VTADTQHYSEQGCLFENAQNALLVKPEVIKLSLSKLIDQIDWPHVDAPFFPHL
jgi:hypothetical protein